MMHRSSRHFIHTARQLLQRRAPLFARSQIHSHSASSASSSSQSAFTLTFTAPQFMLNANDSLGAPIRSQSTLTTNSSSSNAKGCGSPSCCQTMATLTLAEDEEEPFIGAPLLSPSSNQLLSGLRGNTEHSNQNTKINHDQNNNSNNSTCKSKQSSCSTATPAPSPSAPTTATAAAAAATPAPRVKCDPYEQGGHPLSTLVVQQHLQSTLDAGWVYDESKKILVREFNFSTHFRNASMTRGEDTKQLFEFMQGLGNIQVFGNHPLYHLNVNLRSNRLQVMLKTVPLQGISYQDFMLATQVDGMWFRLMNYKARLIKQQQQQQQQQPQGN